MNLLHVKNTIYTKGKLDKKKLFKVIVWGLLLKALIVITAMKFFSHHKHKVDHDDVAEDVYAVSTER